MGTILDIGVYQNVPAKPKGNSAMKIVFVGLVLLGAALSANAVGVQDTSQLHRGNSALVCPSGYHSQWDGHGWECVPNT
jgi:hypothetical protein